MSDIAVDAFGKRVHIDNADRDSEYFCPVCGERMMQKKGAIRINHFAHFSTTNCRESWSSEESDWHRSWKNRFPVDCQEIVIKDEEHIHRADVIVNNAVIEFQHSPISEEDFSARNSFYQKHGYQIVWVFDCIGKIDWKSTREYLLAYEVPWPTVSTPIPPSVRRWSPTADEMIFVQADENVLYQIIEPIAGTSKFLGKKYTTEQFVTKVKQSGVTEDFSFFSEMRKRTENAEREASYAKWGREELIRNAEHFKECSNVFMKKWSETRKELEQTSSDLKRTKWLLDGSKEDYNALKYEYDKVKEELDKIERVTAINREIRTLEYDLEKATNNCEFLKKKNQEANTIIENFRKHILKALNAWLGCKSLLSDFINDSDCVTALGDDDNVYVVDVITGTIHQKYANTQNNVSHH